MTFLVSSFRRKLILHQFIFILVQIFPNLEVYFAHDENKSIIRQTS